MAIMLSILITPQFEPNFKAVLKAASGRGSNQVYDYALIMVTDNAATVTCGDSSIELTSELVGCETKETGSFCVDAAKLMSALSACKFDCFIRYNGKMIEVRNKSSKFTLTTAGAEQYPIYPKAEADEVLQVNAIEFVEKIKLASLIAPEGMVQYQLNGVSVGERIAASDGFRGVLFESEKTPNAIIPTKSVKALPDGAKEIRLSANFMTVKTDLLTFKTKLIDARYPDLNRAFLPAEKTAMINPKSLSDALKASMVTINKVKMAVQIQINESGGKVISTDQNQETATIEFEAESNDSIEVAFNAKYLIDAMQYHSEKVEVGFNDKQMVIKCGDFAQTLMQIKL